jgi:hypothetical protein
LVQEELGEENTSKLDPSTVCKKEKELNDGNDRELVEEIKDKDRHTFDLCPILHFLLVHSPSLDLGNLHTSNNKTFTHGRRSWYDR